MPRVTFLADFDWSPTPRTTIAYRQGMELMVTTPCAEAAIAKGAAQPAEKEARDVQR